MLKSFRSMAKVLFGKASFWLGFCTLAVGLDAQVQISPATPSVGAPQASAQAAPPISPDTVVAEVDGKKYTAGDVERILALFPAQMQPAARKDPQRAFGYILMMRKLAEEGEKANLDKQSPLKETLEYGRIAALSQAEINQVRNMDVKVEMEDEQKFYNEHPERFQEAKVKVIYVAFSMVPSAKLEPGAKKPLTETEAKAKIQDLRKKIEGGADFGKLAKENSDDKESAIKDGDFGMIKRASPYPEPIIAAIFALKPGQVSEPVRQPNGYYLFRSESFTTASYNDVRTQIFDELKQKGFDEWMKSMQKRYEVKVENPAYFAPKSPGPVPPSPR